MVPDQETRESKLILPHAFGQQVWMTFIIL